MIRASLFFVCFLVFAFSASAQITSQAIPNGIAGGCSAVVDIDNDGYTDIVQGGTNITDLYWYDFNDPTKWLNRKIADLVSEATSCDSQDIDFDGDYDIVVADTGGGGAATIKWYENPCNPVVFHGGCTGNVNGLWAVGATIHTGATSDRFDYVGIADYDQDGKLDVSVHLSSGQPSIFFQDTLTSWSELTFSTLLPCATLASTGAMSVDMDDDYDTDFVCVPSLILNPGGSAARTEANWVKHAWKTGSQAGGFSIRPGYIDDLAARRIDILSIAVSGDIPTVWIQPDVMGDPWEKIQPFSVKTGMSDFLQPQFSSSGSNALDVILNSGDIYRVGSYCSNISFLKQKCDLADLVFYAETLVQTIAGGGRAVVGDVNNVFYIPSSYVVSKLNSVATTLVYDSGSLPPAEAITNPSAPVCDGAQSGVSDKIQWRQAFRPGVGKAPTGYNNYTQQGPTGNVTVGGCTGTSLSPQVIGTAAHCFSYGDQDGNGNCAGAYNGNFSTYIYSTDERLWARRVLRPTPFDSCALDYPQPWYPCGDCTSGDDIGIVWVHPYETIPPPYTWPPYDPATQSSQCVGVIQTSSPTTVADTNIRVLAGLSSTGFRYYLHSSIYPPSYEYKSGWSGSPMYALVDPDGLGGEAPVLTWVGPLGGGFGYTSNISALYYKTWIDSYLASGPPPIKDIGFGMSLDDMWVVADRNSATDLAVSSKDISCHIEVTSTGAAPRRFGCVFSNQASGDLVDCFDDSLESNAFECDLQIPRGTVDAWVFDNFWVLNANDERVHIFLPELVREGVGGLSELGIAAGVSPNVSTSVAVVGVDASGHMAPGGDLLCILTVSGDVTNLMSKTYCSFSSPGLDSFYCVDESPYPPRFGNSRVYSTCRVPSWVPVGSIWSYMSGSGRNIYGARATPDESNGVGFTVIDCDSIVPDVASSSGWGTTYPLSPGIHGQDLAEFYVRPQTDSIVAFSDDIDINSLSDVTHAIRFNSSGLVDAWNGTTWESLAPVSYTPNKWHLVRMSGFFTAGVAALSQLAYKVELAECGEYPVVTAANPQAARRPVAGLTRVNVYSSGGSVEFSDLNLRDTLCGGTSIATSCLFENFTGGLGWNCGYPPDGCGGVVADGPCGTCSTGSSCNTNTWICEVDLVTRDLDANGWTYFAPPPTDHTLYVSAVGDDNWDGLSGTFVSGTNGPKATLSGTQGAWSVVVNGQEWHVKLRNGDTFTQTGMLILDKGGATRTTPIWIGAYDDGTVPLADRPTLNFPASTQAFELAASNVCLTDMIVTWAGTGGTDYNIAELYSGFLMEGIWFDGINLPNGSNVDAFAWGDNATYVFDHHFRRNVYSTNAYYGQMYRAHFNDLLYEENLWDPNYAVQLDGHGFYMNTDDNVVLRGNIMARAGLNWGSWKIVQERVGPLVGVVVQNNVMSMSGNAGSGLDMGGNSALNDGSTSPRFSNTSVTGNVFYGLGKRGPTPTAQKVGEISSAGTDFSDWAGGEIRNNLWVWGFREQSQSAHMLGTEIVPMGQFTPPAQMQSGTVDYTGNVWAQQYNPLPSAKSVWSGHNFGVITGSFSNNIMEATGLMFDPANATSMTYSGNTWYSQGTADQWFPGYVDSAAWAAAVTETSADYRTSPVIYFDKRTFEQYHEEVLGAGAATGDYEQMIVDMRSRYNKRDWDKQLDGTPSGTQGIWSGTNLAAWMRAGYVKIP